MSRCMGCWPSRWPCTPWGSTRASTHSSERSTETRCCACKRGEAHKKLQALYCFKMDSAELEHPLLCVSILSFVLIVSETCRCSKSCSASPVPSFYHLSSPITTMCTRITIKNHSSSSSKCLLRRFSSRLSSPLSAGDTLHHLYFRRAFFCKCLKKKTYQSRVCLLPAVSWSSTPPCLWLSWLDFWTCPSRSSEFSCSCSNTRWRTWCGPAASRHWTESSSQPQRSTSTLTRCSGCAKDIRPTVLKTFCAGPAHYNISVCKCQMGKTISNYKPLYMDFGVIYR